MMWNLIGFDKNNGSSYIWNIIGKTRASIFLIFGSFCYVGIYSILVFLNFESVSQFLIAFEPSGPNNNISTVIPIFSIVSGLFAVVICRALFQSYIGKISILNIFSYTRTIKISDIIKNIVLPPLGYGLMFGILLFFPITVLLIPLSAPLTSFLNIPDIPPAGIAFIMSYGMGSIFLISRLHWLSEDTLDPIVAGLTKVIKSDELLDSAEDDIASEEFKDALDNVVQAEQTITNVEQESTLASLRAYSIMKNKILLEKRLEKTVIQLHSTARARSEFYYDIGDYTSSYNAFITAKSARNDLEVTDSSSFDTNLQEEVRIHDIESALRERANELQNSIRSHLRQSEKLVDDSQFDKAIEMLDTVDDLCEEWNEIFELDVISGEPSFQPGKVPQLKRQVRVLKTLSYNLSTLEREISSTSESVDRSLIEPTTEVIEIAKMDDSKRNTRVAIHRFIPICEQLGEIGEYEMAKKGFEIALEAANLTEDSELCETLEAKLESLRTERLTKQFVNQEDYIRDNVLSGESMLEQGRYNRALRQFREANEDLPSTVSDEAKQTWQALHQRINEGLVNARQQILSDALNPTNSINESHLELIRNSTCVGTLQNSENALPTGSAFDRLVEHMSSIIEQLELHHSLQSRAEATQTDYEGHTEIVSEYLTMNINSLSNNTNTVPEGSHSNDPNSAATITSAISDASKIGRCLTESVNSPDDDAEPVSEYSYSADVRTAANIASAISDANEIANAHTEVIETIEMAYHSTSSEEVQQCLSTTEKQLVNPAAGGFSLNELAEMQQFVERISEYDILLVEFPSLPIGRIIQDISASIESGDKIAATEFEREFDRIESLIEPELDPICTEIESFVDTWRNHSSVDSYQWSQAIKRTRNDDEFTEIVNIYQTMQNISNNAWTIEDLHDPDWEEFEHLVASLYTAKGCETEVTQGSKDLGVDVWADNGEERLAIQVKQFDTGNTVGRTVIQQLESTLAREKADTAVVVTSSSFADTAIEYAENSENVELLNGEELVRQLIEYEVQSLANAE